MRTLHLHFPDDALPTLDIFLTQAKEARVFRRAQAVRDVVRGQRLQTVSDTLHFTYSALRKWVHRFADQGVQGLADRPRPGAPPCSPPRPRPTPARLQPFSVELSGTRHGPRPSHGSPAQSRERPRRMKKKTSATAVRRGSSLPLPLSERGLLSNSPPWRIVPVVASSFGSMKMKPLSGVLPCRGRAGGAKPSARGGPHDR